MTHIDKFPDAWLLGIDAIDKEHKALFYLLKSHANSTEKSTYRDGCFLDHFLKELRIHFAHEERVMYKKSYPDTKNHALHHKALHERLAALKTANLSEMDTAQECLKIFIRDIVIEDLKFQKYCSETITNKQLGDPSARPPASVHTDAGNTRA